MKCSIFILPQSTCYWLDANSKAFQCSAKVFLMFLLEVRNGGV